MASNRKKADFLTGNFKCFGSPSECFVAFTGKILSQINDRNIAGPRIFRVTLVPQESESDLSCLSFAKESKVLVRVDSLILMFTY